MISKTLVLCTFAVIVQAITGQVCRSSSSSSGCKSITVSDNGGDLAITSVGPITPSGISLATELGLSGDLDLSGALPYLSAVAFEGQFDTSGVAPVSYGCGDCVAITQEIGNPSGNNAAVGSGSSTISSCGCARRY